MEAEKTATALGTRVYGLGVMAMGAVALVSANVAPAPMHISFKTVAAAFLLVAGAAVIWRRTAAWGAAALVAYYILVDVIARDGGVLIAHYAQYLTYENLAELFALAAGGLIVFAASARIDAAPTARLMRIGQIVFGICAVIFGGAHFAYMNLTAPLIPKWLPPSQEFWGYATGIAQIAAGLAILTNMRARLAATLLAIMYACFIALVWAPMLMAGPANLGRWSEAAETLALIGCAWVVAASLARQR